MTLWPCACRVTYSFFEVVEMTKGNTSKNIPCNSENPAYQLVRRQIMEELPVSSEFKDDDDLISLGLDSLKVMNLVGAWRKSGKNVRFAQLMEKPTLEAWWALLTSLQPPASAPVDTLPASPSLPDQPFPLTDVQYAYWIGRRDDSPLGGVGCHAYLEFDSENMDPVRLEAAWHDLIRHHAMLRTWFLEDGTQQVQPVKALPSLPVHDFRGCLSDCICQELHGVRERLSHRRLHVEEGEVSNIELSLLPDGQTRLHLGVDLLAADVKSLQIIIRDLAALYAGDTLPAERSAWRFSNYLAQEQARVRGELEKAAEYWQGRLDSLPAAPGLPLALNPEMLSRPQFTRRTHTIPLASWERIKNGAAVHGITPAMVLLTAYAEILDRWSDTSRFLINIPLFDRRSDAEGIEDAVADFTNLLLLEVDFSSPRTFLENLEAIQRQFHCDVSHSAYSGVQVQRDLARQEPGKRMFAPVVFACNLGIPLVDEKCQKILGNFSYMISQTPQVWLDFQIYETAEGILLAWDAVDALFPENLVQKMLSSYATLVEWLAANMGAWTQPADRAFDGQGLFRECGVPMPPLQEARPIHAGFFEQAAAAPDSIALIQGDTGREVTYGALRDNTLRIAGELKAQGVGPGTPVAVTMPRGIEQIAAVLGILAVGGCYVPISPEQPEVRRQQICKKASISHVLTSRDLASASNGEVQTVFVEQALTGAPLAEPEMPSVHSLAYIIFTSGSTGQPKGVEITHSGAWQTISEVNRRYTVTAEDRGLAVSALDFDLSVYDIFGLLGVGGSLVLLNDAGRRDADLWFELVDRYHVTLWNSVPILFEMLMVVAESHTPALLPLRLVMLSGDWIGMDLPARLERTTSMGRLVAMGGATEASIWSNVFDVALPLPEHWTSIPYGKPLAGQAFRVVDSKGRDCPDLVPGELWIGGSGVARGYCAEPDLTARSFVNWNGGRWYRTGDMGRYLPDGNLEFLGRKDFQVKIRGHRIELGEIETVLARCPGVKSAVVNTVELPGKGNRLVGYCIPDPQERSLLFDVETASIEDRFNSANAIKQAGSLRSAQMPEPEIIAAFTQFWQGLEILSIPVMCSSLARLGVFTEPGECWDLNRIMTRCRVREGFSKLLGQWLDVLVDENLLVREASGGFRNTVPFPRDLAQELWQELEVNAAKHPEATTLWSFFKNCIHKHVALFRGETSPLELLFPEGGWHIAESLYQSNPIANYYNRIVGDIVASLVATSPRKEPFRIIEVGAGTGGTTASVLPLLPTERTWYEYTDITPFFSNHARDKFKTFPFVSFNTFDINQAPEEQGYAKHSYNLVVAVNVLHDARHIGETLKHLKTLLAPGGWLIILEGTRNIRIQMISVGFIEGFSHFEDQRLHDNLPLLSLAQWQNELEVAGFEPVCAFPEGENPLGQAFFEQRVITAQAPLSVERFRKHHLEGFLRKKLPEYMCPSFWAPVDAWPLNRNGKVDRDALPVPFVKSDQAGEGGQKAPASELERIIADIWSTALASDEIGLLDNFFEVGGDSLIATKLTALIRERLNVPLPLGKFFENPTVAQLAAYVLCQRSDAASTAIDAVLPEIEPDSEALHEPFPLTDIQQAYWIGRTGAYALGNVSAYCYFEIESHNLFLDRLAYAWNRLVRHHGMMRAVVLPGGSRQQILAHTPEFVIPVEDLREVSPDECAKRLGDIRAAMSHQVISTDVWPLFDLRATLYGDQGQVRLHMGFDNLAFDGWSMFHILNEWARLYRCPDADLPAQGLSFRDYVLAVSELENSDFFNRDKTYWLERLTDLPPAPDLPLAQSPETMETQRFERLEFKLDADDWTQLKNRASQRNLTPSGLLLAIFSEVLAFWSKSPRFSINLTLFNRFPLHKQVNEIVGDFTSLTLLEVDRGAGTTFEDRAARLQQQLWDDLDHPYFSGVRVIREYARMHGRGQGGGMPVVFTSALGVETLEDSGGIGDIIYSISQTPQVWLDHQVMERQGALLLNWDFVKDLFPDEMVPQMFHAYCGLIASLAEDEAFWGKAKFDLLPAVQKEKRKVLPEAESTGELLHTGFVRHALLRPEDTSLVFGETILTYGELFDLARQIGDMLLEKECSPNTLVAVIMDKGWAQIAGVLGVLFSGAAYLPIDPETPRERLEFLLANGEVRVVLTSSDLISKITWPEGVSCIAADSVAVSGEPVRPIGQRQQPDDLAYVIYTSGSTGRPKGVMIDHRGAVNTILDINSRFAVTSKDRVLALSNLHFDLSVYDIFGLLAVGASIVVPQPEKRREPSHWADLVNRHGVTMWNTVPALMQMFSEYLSDHSLKVALRLALLSGDWIPLDLPDRIRNIAHNCEIISLGGATEASIWSVLHTIETVAPEWKSIPYGRSMKNQKVRVLNSFMDECPDWVPGPIYIEGIGLAQGYWKDDEKTAKSFLVRPDTGERLYRTGDLGCYLPDGSLRILGREDFQVKINGHRVELGEIEARLNQHSGIREAVVTLDSSQNRAKLNAFLVLEPGFSYNPEELKIYLAKALPNYMIPSVMVPIETLPLTSNGKVDRNLLQNMKVNVEEKNCNTVFQKTETEKRIASIIKNVAQIEIVGLQENFFDLGVDSLQLVRIQSKIEKEFSKHIDIVDFFKFPTVLSLSSHIGEKHAQHTEIQQAESRSHMRKQLRKHRASQR